MADDKAPNIPTLEDVVEIGKPEEESIKIVADNSSVDDAYDDEFNKLFDAPAEQQPVSLDINAEMADDDNDELWDESALQMVENSTGPVTDQAAGSDDELADIKMTAEAEPVEADAEAEADMWIQDWQEEIVESAVIDDMDSDVEITHTTAEADTGEAAAPADTDEASEATAASTIIQAVASDETAEPAAPAAPEQQAATDITEPARKPALNDTDEIGELVNEIVSGIMPEIEWKLRTRIRDILEQRFDAED